MYESFLQAFTTSANQRPSPDARVITQATSPLGPSGPRKKLILAFGAVTGIMLGLGLAFLRNMPNFPPSRTVRVGSVASTRSRVLPALRSPAISRV
jgi:uncharacterized protein involved in exopolysaccharide biosynthesis